LSKTLLEDDRLTQSYGKNYSLRGYTCGLQGVDCVRLTELCNMK